MKKITISDHGNMLFYEKTYSKEFIIKTLKKHSLNGLVILDVLDPVDSLDFLKAFSFITHLRLACIDDHDYSFLREMTNLKWLSIGGSISNKNEIDLRNLTQLEDLDLTWRDNIKGLESCRLVKDLGLIEYKKKDLTPVQVLDSAERIVIKTASIKGLKGLENFKRLEGILLGNCPRLTSISALNGLPNLKAISLNSASKIADFEALTDLPNLEQFDFVDCKNIQSLKFLEKFPKLAKVVIVGNTIIADGDMTPLENVKEVFYSNRKHYNKPFPPANLKRIQRAKI